MRQPGQTRIVGVDPARDGDCEVWVELTRKEDGSFQVERILSVPPKPTACEGKAHDQRNL